MAPRVSAGRAGKVFRPSRAAKPAALSLSADVSESLLLIDSLFDWGWYASFYATGLASRAENLTHYLELGRFAGCDLTPLFISEYYAKASGLLFGDTLSAIVHCCAFGDPAGRSGHPLFDAAFYRAQHLGGNPGESAFVDFMARGFKEGRNPHPLFSIAAYFSYNSDLEGLPINALAHYVAHGSAEGRKVHPLFDAAWYAQEYGADPASRISLLGDFVLHRRDGDRRPNEHFVEAWYLSRYPQAGESGLDPLTHYLAFGGFSGCDPGPGFDSAYYLRANADVAVGGMNPLEHYLTFGRQEGRTPKDAYLEWAAEFDDLKRLDRQKIVKEMAGFRLRPLISIVVPVYNTEPGLLKAAIESVRGQIYGNWELCLSDNASTEPEVAELLRRYAAEDERIKVCLRSSNGHIAANTNTALTLTAGDYVGFLDSDDVLTADALHAVVAEINRRPDLDILYTDEDKIDAAGVRFDPYFKPDWNPALLLSQNYVCHFMVIRRSLVFEAGLMRLEATGSQDHDLLLRCAERTAPERIRHIPRVLYHWRAVRSSTAFESAVKPYAWEAGRRAIEDALARQGIRATVRPANRIHYQVEYDTTGVDETVSIIMPSACKLELVEPCLRSLFARTTYRRWELLLLVNEIRWDDPDKRAFLDELGARRTVRIIRYTDRPFNFSALNNMGVAAATGDVVILMNDDIEVVTEDWMEQLLVRLHLPKVAMCGPALYYPNGTVQHAGVILGMGGVADHAHRFVPKGDGGSFGRAALEQDCSCLTAACVAMPRHVFREVGGFDETLAVAFNDVDLCLRVRQAGYRMLWTPAAEMTHHESATLGVHSSPERAAQFAAEVDYIRTKWGAELDREPFYNPNLSLESGRSYHLAFPPRAGRPLRRRRAERRAAERGGGRVGREAAVPVGLGEPMS
jgi:GT2 family glycosyltransferase